MSIAPLARLLAGCTLILASATAVAAQGGGATPLAPGQSFEQEMASAPHPGQSGVMVTVGAQLQDGRTSTRGWSIGGAAAHTTTHGHLLRLDVKAGYGKYAPGPNRPLVKAEDNQRVTFTYLQRLRPRVYLLGLGDWRRDAIIQLGYRAAAEAGIGAALVEHRRVQLFAGTSFAVGREDRDYLAHSEKVQDLGVMQSLRVILGTTALFEQSLKTHIELGNADDHTTSFDVSLSSRLSRFAGVKVEYSHQYDALHPIDQPASQREVTVGLQFKWPVPRPAAP